VSFLRPLGASKGGPAGLPLDWDEHHGMFISEGKNDWKIGWIPYAFGQLRIQVMRYHHPRDRMLDVKREL